MNRVEQVRIRMKQYDVNALLISSQSNVYYVSGFYAEAGVANILLTQEHAYLMSDGRFMTEAQDMTTGFNIVRWHKNMYTDMGELIEHLGISTVVIDDEDLSYAQVSTLLLHTKAAIIRAPKLIEELRSIKSKDELACIREACHIADEAFQEVLNFIRPGVSEQAVCNELEFQMRKRGAATCSFEIIVASGARGALPHGVASEKRIELGDMVTMDFGALYHHYCSDITRTVAIGKPNDELVRIYGIVKETQQRMSNALRQGIISKDLEFIGRSFIEENGFQLIHGPGHSFGLDIHEAPFISSSSDYAFEEGVVVTLEPGIYVPGLGGIRIEDDYLVMKNGCVQLTQADKELIILPF